MMETTFFKRSKKIADRFMQSILFVDDEIYSDKGNGDHILKAQELTRIFSKANKLCTLNNPEKEDDFKDVIKLAKKADVSVLDWKMLFDSESENIEDEEADIDEEDPRGDFTLKLIQEILSDNGSNGIFKLIVIYTGEVILNEIVEKIYSSFDNHELKKISNNCIGKQNIKIIVIGKPTLKRRLRHQSELIDWIVDYPQIPDFILNEFTKMTNGLVSNVALSAISSIRENSFKILNEYNMQMDPAFLSHRSMLPLPDDAGELLKDSIINSFDSIIDYDQIEKYASIKYIKEWMNCYDFNEQSIRIQNKDLILSSKELKYWQEYGFQDTIQKIWEKNHFEINLNPGKVQRKYKELHKTSENYFLPTDFVSKDYQERFSILTHHKSSFANPSYVPKLSLGSVIKGKKSGKYWICIQQKCDSVRIYGDEARRFLFLPLNKVDGNGKFNFLIENEGEYIKLKIDFDSHNLRTIKFKSNKDGMVLARRYGRSKRYFFNPLYYKGKSNKVIDQNYLWIMDLKDSHAQRVADHYSSILSRVGLDESEWLRRWST